MVINLNNLRSSIDKDVFMCSLLSEFADYYHVDKNAIHPHAVFNSNIVIKQFSKWLCDKKNIVSTFIDMGEFARCLEVDDESYLIAMLKASPIKRAIWC